jgi:hypothetical protein
MLGQVGALHGSPRPFGAHHVGLSRQPAAARRLLLAVAVLSLLVAAFLTHALPAARPSSPPTMSSTETSLLRLPLAGRASISGALGAHSPAYRVRHSRGSLRALSQP